MSESWVSLFISYDDSNHQLLMKYTKNVQKNKKTTQNKTKQHKTNEIINAGNIQQPQQLHHNTTTHKSQPQHNSQTTKQHTTKTVQHNTTNHNPWQQSQQP